MVAWEAYGKHAAFHSLPSIHGQTDGMSEFWQKIKAILSAPVEMGRNGKHVNSVTQTEPTTPSFAAGQQQMTQDLAALRQTAEQLAGGQDQMARESPIPHVLNALRCYMKAKNQKCYM